MELVWIAGISGVGKTSVLNVLTGWGLPAQDADKWSDWYDASGKAVSGDFARSNPGEHSWNVDLAKVSAMKRRVEKVGFLGGCVANEEEAFKLCGRVVFLDAPLTTILTRIDTRVGNDYGKRPGERENIIARWEVMRERHLRRGSVVIENTGDIEDTTRQACQLVGLGDLAG